MEQRDRAGLEQRFAAILDHLDVAGRLRPSDLQLPIFASPPYLKQPLEGYEGGAFDPATLGVACIVVPPTDCLGANSSGDWNLRQVSAPPSFLPDRPAALQHLNLGERALVPA
jgi:hypothetical protein